MQNTINQNEIRDFLNSKVEQYNNPEFIENDPISIPHQFKTKEDIEISAFLSATIAWGQRKTILKNANNLMQHMDYAPHDFVTNAEETDYKRFDKFVHRTFNGIDCTFFLKSLKNIYTNHNGIEGIFVKSYSQSNSIKRAIDYFREIFFELVHEKRTEKHVASPNKKSTAKRINMFLRWMVRKDNKGVDFGLWESLKMSDLYCPLDIHSGNVSRVLGLLQRKQNDWLAVEQLTEALKDFDPNDPIKYDFALFSLGVDEKIC